MSLPKPGDLYGKFQLGRLIGRGGMGAVFEATDTVLKRQVALKVVLPTFEAADMFTARFEREATVLARVRSRHIVNIHEYGEHEGTAYLVTELFPDGDLKAWVTAHGAFAPLPALTLIDQIFAGLQDAHDVGVLHRDIKPSNILLWSRPDGLLAYLCDFGIAADGETTGLTSTGAVLGSYTYMAPERHTETDFDVRSDIYSVGCVLYALLTGQAPYQGSDFQVSSGHINGPVPQVIETGEVTAGLNKLLAWLLAKNPDERPASVTDARREIAHLINLARESGEEGLATPPAPPEPEDEITSVRTPTPTPTPVIPADTTQVGRKREPEVPETPAPPPPPVAPPVASTVPPPSPVPPTSSDRRPSRGRVIAAVAAVAALVAGGLLVANLASGDDKDPPGASASTPSAPATGGTAQTADPMLRRVAKQVDLAGGPRSAVLSPDEKTLYVAVRERGVVSVIDAATLEVGRSITVGGEPSALAVEDENHVLVTVAGSGELVRIDTRTDALTRIKVGSTPASVTIAPDRRTAWVANQKSDSISVVDLASSTVTDEIPAGSEPVDLVFTADGATGFVPNYTTSTVTVIDTAARERTTSVKVGKKPTSVALGAGDRFLYVAAYESNRVDVIDVAAREKVGQIPAFAALGFAVSPARKYLYVTTQGDATLVVSTATNKVVRRIPSRQSWVIMLDRSGKRGYVSNNVDGKLSLLTS